MWTEYLLLALSAAGISIVHTATGPDHYLPFIVLSKANAWSRTKTTMLTIICGLGHIFSSVLIGAVGVFLGWQLSKLDFFTEFRGNIAAWALLSFGFAYLCYGLYVAYKNKPHKHFDILGDDVYVFEHRHGEMVMPQKRVKVTPFVLFAIFVMGPSEPLVPLLFYSGTQRSVEQIIILLVVFSVCTVLTMLAMVYIGLYGYSFFKTEKLERYVHAIGGVVVMLCGLAMVFGL